ncbi:hypothetical protein XHC_3200 [Xanthomonas hortorum pv. carotae str. M081]|nr:hypothetical protein XHC_3200 [Xanthomonas hortorum pv. carotae str. M081]
MRIVCVLQRLSPTIQQQLSNHRCPQCHCGQSKNNA